MIEEKKTCGNCGASYEVKHALPEEDYIERFCPFCGEEKEMMTRLVMQRIDTKIGIK